MCQFESTTYLVDLDTRRGGGGRACGWAGRPKERKTLCTSVWVACEGIKDTLPSARSRALGKASYFFYFSTYQRELLKCSNLCRVSTNWTLGKENICRALSSDTRQNIFIFFFFHPNFFYCDSRLPWTTYAGLAHYSNCLLHLVNLFHLIELLGIIQIWIASHSKSGKNESKNDIHIIEPTSTPYP
jgi:hypothetical protein